MKKMQKSRRTLRKSAKIPTIREIASKAGLSIATVSYVFSGARKVNDETAARVRAAAIDLGYIPNRLATSLRAQNTRIIGILVPDIRNPFFPSIMDAIKRYITPKNYEVFVASSDEKVTEQNKILESFLQYHVAGAIVVSTGSDEEVVDRLQAFQERAPIVLVDRNVQALSCPKVLLRNASAAKQLVRCLSECGHSRIGILAPPTTLSIGQERIRGYTTALRELGIRVQPELKFIGDLFATSGERAAAYFCQMDIKARPTAIVSCSDVMTIGLLRGLARMSIRVPQDISIVSFDDTDYFPLMNPPITCISQPTESFGKHAAELLVSAIENRLSEMPTMMLNGTLKLRNSVRCLARSHIAPMNV